MGRAASNKLDDDGIRYSVTGTLVMLDRSIILRNTDAKYETITLIICTELARPQATTDEGTFHAIRGQSSGFSH